MPATVGTLPYPLPTDPPDGAAQIEALARATDAQFTAEAAALLGGKAARAWTQSEATLAVPSAGSLSRTYTVPGGLSSVSQAFVNMRTGQSGHQVIGVRVSSFTATQVTVLFWTNSGGAVTLTSVAVDLLVVGVPV